MPYYDKDAILESLTKEDIIRILIELGSDCPKNLDSNSLQFRTVCHGGDSHKLYYYHNPKHNCTGRVFHCYTGCGDSFGIYELVMRAKRQQGENLTFYQAVRFVAEITNKTKFTILKTPIVSDKINDWSWITKLQNVSEEQTSFTVAKSIRETYLDMFSYFPQEEWIQEYISREVMGEFEIGFWGKTNQITIPHRNLYGELIGIRGRFLNEEDIKKIGKYAPLFIEGNFLAHSLGNNLYGLFQNQHFIKKYRKVLLLESEKSVLQSHSYFGNRDFSLAVCGSNITPTQVRLILRYLKVEEIILGFDKEYENPDSLQAEVYRNKLLKKVVPFLPYVNVSILWDEQGLLNYKDSPTDRGKDTLLKLLEDKRIITIKDLKLLNEIGRSEVF